jgi:hypothetical protein
MVGGVNRFAEHLCRTLIGTLIGRQGALPATGVSHMCDDAWGTARLLLFVLATGVARGDVVYDNTQTRLSKSFNAGSECGDEIVLGCPYGPVRSCTITGVAFDYVGQNFHGDERVRIRFYLNDGALGSAGVPKPGTVAYDSGFFGIVGSTGGTTARRDNLAVRNVPGSLTWTVEFQGINASESVGLLLYSPPAVGKNYDDYWERKGDDWLLKALPGTPMSFSALILATDVVAAEDLRVRIELGPPVEGKRLLHISGPSKRNYVVEASADLRTWQTITNFTSGTAATTCFDYECFRHPQRFYRAWKSYPGSLPQVRLSAQPVSPGSFRLAVRGEPGRIYVVEQSSDLLGWSHFLNFQSSGPESLFLEPCSGNRRFFRVKQ